MRRLFCIGREPFLAALLFSCTATAWLSVEAAEAPAEEVHLTFLHVNDVHGQLQPRTDGNGQSVGGYARLATAVNEVRRTTLAERVFLIHAGDQLSRGDELSRASSGRADIAIMNRIGFDLFVPGNGEFYGGVVRLLARLDEATCKALAANVTRRVGDQEQPLAAPYSIETVGPLRIAFLGLCTIRQDHASARPLQRQDPYATAARLIPELRKKADLVVAITHIGVRQDERLVAEVDGLDLVIGGHSHTALHEGKLVTGPTGRSVLICQAGGMLRYLGRVDLVCRKTDQRWEIVDHTASLISLDESVPLDPEITALIAGLSDAFPPATRPAAELEMTPENQLLTSPSR